MTRIIGTNDGKIFMAGNDGFLYHLAYGQSQVRSVRCARVIESGGPSPESEAIKVKMKHCSCVCLFVCGQGLFRAHRAAKIQKIHEGPFYWQLPVLSFFTFYATAVLIAVTVWPIPSPSE